MDYRNTFKVDDWAARGISVVMELYLLAQASILVYPVLHFFDIMNAVNGSVALGSVLLWFTYVSKTPFQQAESGLEDDKMTMKRGHRYTHSFYRVAQSTITLYAIVWIGQVLF